MEKAFTVVFLFLFTISVKAQDKVPNYQDYGKISMADLNLKYCDFEKDANAEVLFDVGKMISYSGIFLERHTRIKIFNDQGKNEANVRIIHRRGEGAYFDILNLKAETINVENNKIVCTPIDAKLVSTVKIDDFFDAIVFSFPNVKTGSVIEYKYTAGMPDTWFFQSNLPTRYSEINVDFNNNTKFRYIPHVDLPYIKNIGGVSDYQQIKALGNIPSFTNEPYMSSRPDNLQRIDYIIWNSEISTWDRIGDELILYHGFGDQFSSSISGEEKIIDQAKALKTLDDKIAYIFDKVKNNMAWNNVSSFGTYDGISRAWDKKTGNSAEINLIVYRLLKKSGIKAYPFVVSDRKNQKINPINPNIYSLTNTFVYIPVDSINYYVLDATNKYNQFNVLPQNVLNTFGLIIDTYGGAVERDHHVVFIDDTLPSTKYIYLNAEIKLGGTLEGIAQINCTGYSRVNSIEEYKTDGEKKYKDYLVDNNNDLKISSIKMENMDDDTLPLIQNVNFVQDLSASTDNYIYLSPNLFVSPHTNPFIKTTRNSDIDFGWRDNLVINGVFKIPVGYKADALPQTILMSTPDGSITFKRMVNLQDNMIAIRYVINHKKTIYFKNEYDDFSEFYKKMYEMLNEPIVLKKS